jgi:hypothetical protein
MQTSLAIDDDVLAAARIIAEQQDRDVGEVISDLARRSLPDSATLRTRNGVPLLPTRPGARTVTHEIVKELRDELL